eukprot:jgi/Bigna1/66549/fgenesh1_pg.1_\
MTLDLETVSSIKQIGVSSSGMSHAERRSMAWNPQKAKRARLSFRKRSTQYFSPCSSKSRWFERRIRANPSTLTGTISKLCISSHLRKKCTPTISIPEFNTPDSSSSDEEIEYPDGEASTPPATLARLSFRPIQPEHIPNPRNLNTETEIILPIVKKTMKPILLKLAPQKRKSQPSLLKQNRKNLQIG